MRWGIELVLVGSVAILPSVIGSVLTLLQPEASRARLEISGPFQISLSRFVQSIGGIAAVALVALHQPAGLASVGLRLGQGNVVGDAVFDSLLVVGLVSAVALLAAIILRLRRRPKGQASPGLPPELAYQKTTWDRVLYATVMPFSAIAEEMTYRGYLVLLFVGRTGTLLPWILLSIGLTITIHLYQGLKARLILFHTGYAGLMIWLTLTTGGIEGPILIHALINTVSFIRSWRTGDDRQGNDAPEAESPAESPTGLKRLGYVIFIGMNLALLSGLCCSSILLFR